MIGDAAGLAEEARLGVLEFGGSVRLGELGLRFLHQGIEFVHRVGASSRPLPEGGLEGRPGRRSRPGAWSRARMQLPAAAATQPS